MGLKPGNTYLPGSGLNEALDYIEFVQKNSGRAFLLPVPDQTFQDYCPPVIGGHMAGVLAQTSHGKTMFLMALAELNSARLFKANERAVVVYVHLEENIQDIMLQEIARLTGIPTAKLAIGDVDLKKLRSDKRLAGLYTLPIARVAATMSQKKKTSQTSLFLSQVEAEMAWLRAEGYEVAGLIVDYLTALPLDPMIQKQFGLGVDGQRRLQVREDAYKLRLMGNDWGIPVFIGLQAKQELGCIPAPGVLIPGDYDVSETKDVSERLDRLYSLWMPKRNYPGASKFRYNGDMIGADEDMTFIRVLKQKGGHRSGRIFCARWNYQKRTLSLDKKLN